MPLAATVSSTRWGFGKSKCTLASGVSARERAIADVVPVLHAAPGYGIRKRVGLLPRLGPLLAHPPRAQHAAAVGQNPACRKLRAGMEDLARQAGGLAEALDHVAPAHALRGTRGGHDDAERGARVPPGVHGIKRAGKGRVATPGEIA